MTNQDRVNQLKALLTGEDLAKFERDMRAKEFLDESYTSTRDLHKFLMLYNITFIANNSIDIDLYISDLRTAYDSYVEMITYNPKSGH